MAQNNAQTIQIPPILQVSALAGHYANAKAAQLHSVHLTLMRGSIAAITGDTGSGKTLLIKLLQGEAIRTNGTVHLLGEDPTTLSKEAQPFLRRQLAVVHQGLPLLPNLSVLDNILLPTLPQHATTTPEQALQWCSQFNLDSQGKAAHLSCGQQQIVRVLRALSTTPRLLLLDNPVGGCDDVTQQHMAQLLLNAARAGAAICVTLATYTMLPLLFAQQYVLRDGSLHVIESAAATPQAPPRDNLGFLAEPVDDEALAEIF